MSRNARNARPIPMQPTPPAPRLCSLPARLICDALLRDLDTALNRHALQGADLLELYEMLDRKLGQRAEVVRTALSPSPSPSKRKRS